MDKVIVLIAALCALLPTATAQCTVDGVNLFPQVPGTPHNLPPVLDIASGEFFRAATTNINSITFVPSGDAMNNGPYVTTVLTEDGDLVFSLTSTFTDFEEYEYRNNFNIRVDFACTTVNPFVIFHVTVVDTNNHPPSFRPSDSFNFNVLPPIVPGYELTGCLGDIVVRDIDLTTQSIIFGIQDNPYFEIEYGGRDPSDSKNFFAILRATNVIMSLPEPLVLQISAQDVDQTLDDPLTTYGTITIEADPAFQLPAEPVFSRPYYTATYNDDHTITVHQDITLSQGYDSEVDFRLTGDHETHFDYDVEEEHIVIVVVDPLTEEDLEGKQHIVLVVHADREFTSGDTATIIVELPQAPVLRFEEIRYEGIINFNVLELDPLVLSETGTGAVTANIISEHSGYFTPQVTGDTISVTMTPLPDAIIEQNNFISLVVEATSASIVTSTVIVLDIIKDDTTTPVFDQNIYDGTYDSTGLDISDFVLRQGYDETVTFALDGDDSDYFQIDPQGDTVRLLVRSDLSIPESDQPLIFNVLANKPMTVGAAATVYISRPAAPALRFEETRYEGLINYNVLELEPLVLSETGSGSVTANIISEHSEYFTPEVTGDTISVTMTPLPDTIIEQNNFISLVVEATSASIVTSTVVVLDIIKDDTTTPVFDQNIYDGTYDSTGLDISDFVLRQGYDETVTFALDGDDSDYFQIDPQGDTVRLLVRSDLSIPESDQPFKFTVLANKPMTVGATATVYISRPAAPALRFEEIRYEGLINYNVLELEPLVLSETGSGSVTANIISEHSEYFTPQVTGDTISVTMTPLPDAIIEQNNFISLVVEATSASIVTSTVVVLDIIKDDTTTPVFDQNIYDGTYDSTGLDISDFVLRQGYDETVTFALDGDDSDYFQIDPQGDTVRLLVRSDLSIPESEQPFKFTVLANKPMTVGAAATVYISRPAAPALRFEEIRYEGLINFNVLELEPLVLSETGSGSVTTNIISEHSEYFTPQVMGDTISINMTPLPDAIIEQNNFISLVVEATSASIVTSTVVVLDIIKDDTTTPLFDQNIYDGTYDSTGLDISDFVLRQGYDGTVTFALDGDDSDYFQIDPQGDTVRLLVRTDSSIPESEQPLIFNVLASKPMTVGAAATVYISRPAASILTFEEIRYEGLINYNVLELEALVLSETGNGEVTANIISEHSEYFTPQVTGDTIVIIMTPLPEAVIQQNSFISFVIEATSGGFVTSAVVVLDIKKDDTTTPVFDQNFYIGTYDSTGLEIADFFLSQGYDETVTFNIGGDDSDYFQIEVDGDMVRLIVRPDSPIPESRQQLMFYIQANKPMTVGATATVSILLPAGTVLRFEEIRYEGIINYNVLELEPLVLAETGTGAVTANIISEHSEYFTPQVTGGTIVIIMTPLPEAVIQQNSFISFVIGATSGGFVTSTVVVLDIKKDDTTTPVFDQNFYIGTYDSTGLEIADFFLSQGYDETVTFNIGGDDSDYFQIEVDGDTVRLIVRPDSPIPESRQQLMFYIQANKPMTVGATATVSILLPAGTVLRFEEIRYEGIINYNALELEPLVLAETGTGAVTANIISGYSEHFTTQVTGGIITIFMTPLPETVIQPNNFISLVVEAASGGFVTSTVVVLDIRKDDTTTPVFDQNIYVGTYDSSGLEINDIFLRQGYDDTVTFTMEGDDSDYFQIEVEGGTVILLVRSDSPIPESRQQLKFSVLAHKPMTVGAAATVSISLPTGSVLRFEEIRYEGIINYNVLELEPLVLAETGTGAVTANIISEYSEYFTTQVTGGTITVIMAPLPEVSIQQNNFFSLVVEAISGGFVTSTVVVLDIRKDDTTTPVFAQNFYIGTYDSSGLEITDIFLRQGYDDTVTFDMEGDDSVYFQIDVEGDTVRLLVRSDSPIPESQQQLKFSVLAHKPMTVGAAAAVSISLPTGSVLRFEEIRYEGIINYNVLELEPLVLAETGTGAVSANIISEHSEYFTPQVTGGTIVIIMMPLPEAVIQQNSFISFVIEATSGGFVTSTVIVLDIKKDDTTTPVFDQNFYIGTYNPTGLEIADFFLSQGYDETVTFNIGGDDSDYFQIEVDGETVRLIVRPDSPIPESRQQLMFYIQANKPMTVGATATVSIILPTGSVLRFEEIRYEGIINYNVLELEPLILTETGTGAVTANIISEYSEYFTTQVTGGIITIFMTPLPEAVIQPNNFISLLVEATSGGFVTSTVIVLDIRKDDTTTPVFDQNIYVGTYDSTGLEINEIFLRQGYDDTVTFDMEGDDSDYFQIDVEGDTVRLLVRSDSPIPESRQQLKFSVLAHKPTTVGAAATVSISLPTGAVLRFEEIRYEGIINYNVLELEPLVLAETGTGAVTANIISEYSEYFTTQVTGGTITVIMTPLPQVIIQQNNFFSLVVEAISGGFVTSTVVVLDIRKDDTRTPVFAQNFYIGTYDSSGLEITDIFLRQGYDDTVTFDMEGDDSDYFQIDVEGDTVRLLVRSDSPIPESRQQLKFSVLAHKPMTVGAAAAVSIYLPTWSVLRFEEIRYEGIINYNVLELEPLVLAETGTGAVTANIISEFSEYFTTQVTGGTITVIMAPFPEVIIQQNNFFSLVVEAISGGFVTSTVVVLDIRKDDTTTPVFAQNYYIGTYDSSGLEITDIFLRQGYDDTVTFDMEGDDSDYFQIDVEGDTVRLLVRSDSPIPESRQQLKFSVLAHKPMTVGAAAAVSIYLPTGSVLRFEEIRYEGIINYNVLELEPLVLAETGTGAVTANIISEYYEYFTTQVTGGTITVIMAPLPEVSIQQNNFFSLVVEATSGGFVTSTVVVLDIRKDDTTTPVFAQNFYIGTYDSSGLEITDLVLRQGYDDTVTFDMEGDDSDYFQIEVEGDTVILLVRSDSPIPESRQQLKFSVLAHKPMTVGAAAAVSIYLPTGSVLRFEEIRYKGLINYNVLELEPLVLTETGTGAVTANILSEHSDYFTTQVTGGTITVIMTPLPEAVIQQNNFISLVVEAISGGFVTSTVIVLDIRKDDATTPVFDQNIYVGTYDSTGLQIADFLLRQGYDETVTFDMDGDDSDYFQIEAESNTVRLSVRPNSPIPDNRQHLLFPVLANKPMTVGASATVYISLPTGPEGSIFFDRGLYTGRIEEGVTDHEDIYLRGYSGTVVQISGEYSTDFVAAVVSDEGRVEVRAADSTTLPHLTHLPLLLQAATARTALVLSVHHLESPEPPTVSFESSSYVLRADVSQSGLLARVTASASNGETVQYSLVLDNGHLEERLSVSGTGELWLSAPADSGIYQFTVRATTVATQVSAEATVHLTVDSVMVCGIDDRVLHPLIVLERDEEEPHDNLYILNDELAADCSYDFTYRWPSDRDWFYINDQGHLAARAIDREDPAIAFMAVSQVQIELYLSCTTDEAISRQKRDLLSENRTLGHYDYGTRSWILTEGITYNSRRSFVNLIVNDINDNPPIFIGKEEEPIAVGYPVANLLEAVNPSALITVQATDADIGINAELVYWSSAEELAVSSRTGAVYVRDNFASELQSGTIFTISASDLAGAPGGHIGTIDIMVRLLELNHIAVLTIRNALLEDAEVITEQLTDALQYDVKILRASVISDQYEVLDVFSRLSSKRFYDSTFRDEASENENVVERSERQAEIDETGATLRMFICGLANTEPVEVTQLISDIENAEIPGDWLSAMEAQDLQEHLDSISNTIAADSNVGLLVSTIVLSCILFIIVVLASGWFFFKWWKARRYTQFSDSSSNASEPLETLPKLEDALRPRLDDRPRPNIEEVKRTERLILERLEKPIPAPVPESSRIEPEIRNETVSEVPLQKSVTFETVSEVPQQEKPHPIVIQSIDKLKTDEDTEDEDEFGERISSRRKSVVTFNEQVEKIIEVNNVDTEEDADVMVHRL